MQILGEALALSRRELTHLLLFTMICTILFSSAIYYAEFDKMMEAPPGKYIPVLYAACTLCVTPACGTSLGHWWIGKGITVFPDGVTARPSRHPRRRWSFSHWMVLICAWH